MRKNRRLIALLLTLALLAVSACAPTEQPPGDGAVPDRERFVQVSTLQALMQGDYYGNESVGDLLAGGDFGLGTFKGVNGEMIVLDGVCYRALADGTVEVAAADETTPFACVTMFDPDATVELGAVDDIDALKDLLDGQIRDTGSNSPYACKITGQFATVRARSELAQSEPYKPLAEVLLTDQREFDFEDVAGTLVCVYFPDYMEGINAVGWHMHFISEDKSRGGHVFDLALTSGIAEFDRTDGFAMQLPGSDYFQQLLLTEVSREAVSAVETGN